MYSKSAIKAYQQVSNTSLTDRDADAETFRIIIHELEQAIATNDLQTRLNALVKHQRLWSLIQAANAVENPDIFNEDRLLFARMADRAQKYGIRALLDADVSLLPLIEVAKNVLDGLVPLEETHPQY